MMGDQNYCRHNVTNHYLESQTLADLMTPNQSIDVLRKQTNSIFKYRCQISLNTISIRIALNYLNTRSISHAMIIQHNILVIED